MDDVIYILIGVAWVAFSIYNANQKKKQRAARAMTPGSPQQMEPPRKKSILEEILMGEEMPAFEEIQPETEIEEEFVPEYQAAIAYQKDIQERLQQAELRYTPMIVEPEKPEKETASTIYETPVTILKTFNLRQAVIYSMILERPYR